MDERTVARAMVLVRRLQMMGVSDEWVAAAMRTPCKLRFAGSSWGHGRGHVSYTVEKDHPDLIDHALDGGRPMHISVSGRVDDPDDGDVCIDSVWPDLPDGPWRRAALAAAESHFREAQREFLIRTGGRAIACTGEGTP